jgi:hypothetical protein
MCTVLTSEDETRIEHAILREFGRCLHQIIANAAAQSGGGHVASLSVDCHQQHMQLTEQDMIVADV